MKTLLICIAVCFSISAQSQISKVNLQASGLTCSMCSNAINKALKTLDFVQKIEADIQTSTFEITFKQGANVDFDKLKKKVEDAGFSVAKFVATIHFNNIQVKPNEPVKVADKVFRITNAKDEVLNGDKQITIIDKGYVSAKQYKKVPIATLAEKEFILQQSD